MTRKPTLSLPKPPAVPRVGEAKARRVVGKDDAPTSKSLKEQKPKKTTAAGKRLGRPPTLGGAKHETWERLQVYVPREVMTRLRVMGAQRRAELSDLVTEALESFLPRP